MAWSLNGTNYTGSATGTPDYDGDYSCSLWANVGTPAGGTYYALLMMFGDFNNYDLIAVDSGGLLYVQAVLAGTLTAYTGASVAGGWHHFGLVHDGGLFTHAVYLDGVYQSTIADVGTRATPMVTIYCGTYAAAAYNAVGSIDCLKIWDYRMGPPQMELEALYRSPIYFPSGVPSQPIHWLDPVLLSGDKLLNRGSGSAWVEGGTVVLGDGPPIFSYPSQRPQSPRKTRANLNGVYATAKEGFLGGTFTWSASTLKAVAITDGYTPNLATDQFVSDIPAGSRIATSGALSGKTVTLGYADCGNVTFRNVNQKIEALAVYVDGASPSAQRLICYVNTGTNLPLHPYGADALVSWGDIASVFRL